MLARWAGSLWFGAQIALAGRIRHLDAGVTMEDFRRGLDLHYHGLGGTLARRVVGDAGHLGGNRLSAAFSSGLHDLMAWLDPEQVHLPRSINRYPTRALNRELFFWLAAFMAEDRPLNNIDALPAGVHHLLRGVVTSARIERVFPALGERHARLCAAELAQRAQVLPGWHGGSNHPVRVLESAIRYALGSAQPPSDPLAGRGHCRRARRHRDSAAGLATPWLPVALPAGRAVGSAAGGLAGPETVLLQAAQTAPRTGCACEPCAGALRSVASRRTRRRRAGTTRLHLPRVVRSSPGLPRRLVRGHRTTARGAWKNQL